MSRRLVALRMEGGPDYVAAVQRIWDHGDAVAPLPVNAPEPHLESLLAMLQAEVLIDPSGDRTQLAGGRPVEDGDALVIATSGTSGAPKGVVHTHRALEYMAFATSTALGADHTARWLVALPLNHIGGFSILPRALHTGASLEVLARFDAARVEQAAHAGATHTSLVTTALGRIDASLFRRILLGGSAIPADRPANCVATYGMTETASGVVYDGLALNGVSMRIDRPDADGLGHIRISSPTLLRCYRDGTDPVDDEGYLATGDLGRIDPTTGRLSVRGRADEVIVTGGHKVWPEPVETLLRADPSVADAAVRGRTDPEWGQAVEAVVVPTDAASPPGLGHLRSLIKEHLPAYCAPHSLVLVDRLPRSDLGKLRRREFGRM
ncbi:MAG: AMP-binding protein [Microthrixaceae bacterium]